MMPAPPPCPHCAGHLIPLAWGMPDSELFEAADRGEVAIGGCIVPDDPWPGWRCQDCGRDVHLTEQEAEA